MEYTIIIDIEGDPWGCFLSNKLPTTIENLCANADLDHPELAPHRAISALGVEA